MAFGFKRIVDLSNLSIKDLNDQLELLWKKVMGGVTANDLYAGESTRIIEENADSIRLLAGSTGRRNFIRNGRGDHGTSGYEGDITVRYDSGVSHNALGINGGTVVQYGIPIEAGQTYTLSCLVGHPYVRVYDGAQAYIRLYAQRTADLDAKDVTVLESGAIDISDYFAGYTTFTHTFTAPSDAVSLMLEVQADKGCMLTDVQLVRGGVPLDWIAGENEIYSSGIEVYDDRVNIETSNFSLKILDPATGEATLNMSADMNGFDYLNAGKLDAGDICVADGKAPESYYISSFSGSDANDGLTADTPLKTIGEATRRIPRIGAAPCSILLRRDGTYYESIELYGFPGTVMLGAYGTGSRPKLHGKVHIESCGGLDMTSLDIQDDIYNARATVEVENTPADIRLCFMTRGSGAYAAIPAVRAVRCCAVVRSCTVNGYDIGVEAGQGACLHVYNSDGSCNTSVSADGGLVTGYMQWPSYTAQQFAGKNGGAAVTQGEATQIASIDDPPASATQKIYYSTAYSVFKNDAPITSDRLYQGADGSGRYSSAVAFDNAAIRADVAGKTILSARFFLQILSVNSASARVRLGGSAETSVDVAAPPAIVHDAGYVASIPASGGMWFGVPVELAQALADGTVNTFVLADDNMTNYFAAAVPARLELIYM